MLKQYVLYLKHNVSYFRIKLIKAHTSLHIPIRYAYIRYVSIPFTHTYEIKGDTMIAIAKQYKYKISITTLMKKKNRKI